MAAPSPDSSQPVKSKSAQPTGLSRDNCDKDLLCSLRPDSTCSSKLLELDQLDSRSEVSWFLSPTPSSTSNLSLFFDNSSGNIDERQTLSTVSLNSCVSELKSSGSASPTESLVNRDPQNSSVDQPVVIATAANKSASLRMGQTDNSPKNTTAHRGRLRELNENRQTSFPCTIRLPDGEETNPNYKNFKLHSAEEAMMNNVFCPPPNRTVDRTVCENLYWNESHYCPGDRFDGCPPSSYGSQFGSHCSKDHCNEPSSSKRGKLKEVFNSVLDIFIPSSVRNGSRRQNGDSRPITRSSSCHAENRTCQQSKYCIHPATTTTAAAHRASPSYCPLTGFLATEYSGPPPPYKKVVKGKKAEEKKTKDGGN